MTRLMKILSVLPAAAVLAGCTAIMPYPPAFPSYEEATEHYRTVERFDRVVVKVEIQSQLDEPTKTQFATSIREEAAYYLGRNGIEYLPANEAAGAAVPTLALIVTPVGEEFHMLATLTAANGKQLEKTFLYHKGGRLSDDATAQQLAAVAIDDMLLIWYPDPETAGELQSIARPTRFALYVDDVEPQSVSGASVLSWEEFPSARLLKGSGVAAKDISDVSYEVRIHKGGAMVLFHRYLRSDVFRAGGIIEPRYTVPFILPSCEYIVWSVRAHFRLHGHPRVTEWSGHTSTTYNGIASWPILPPYMHRRAMEQDSWAGFYRSFDAEHNAGSGTRAKIEPPPSVKCGELGRGFGSYNRAEAEFDEPVRALAPGESIAALGAVEQSCRSERCDFEPGIRNASGGVAACLANEFSRRKLEVPVRDLSVELAGMPVPYTYDTPDIDRILRLLRHDENRRYLQDQGIRYLLIADMELSELNTVYEMDAEFPFMGSSTTTQYSAGFNSSVIDTATGKIIGSIRSSETGGKGSMVGFVLIVPIAYVPYGSVGRIEKRACDAVARQMSFMLRGGKSQGWPQDEFTPIHAPLWVRE